MIVILCDDYKDSFKAFNQFCNILKWNPYISIVEANKYTLRVYTDDGFVYAFIDYRMIGLFEGVTEDVMERDEFFEGLLCTL